MTSFILLGPLSGESLYSWAARVHRINGFGSSTHTSKLLFDDPLLGLLHDFTGGLSHFSHFSHFMEGDCGDAASIAHSRTTLSYFLPLRGQAQQRDLTSELSGPSGANIKYRLGILTSRFGCAHPLKACPQCMADDLQTVGVSYWHLAHQYPSALVCSTHGVPLLEDRLKIHRLRHHYLLPDQAHWGPVTRLAGRQATLLRRYADLSQSWAREAPFLLTDTTSLVKVLRRRLIARGYSTNQGGPALSQYADDYLAHIGHIARLTPLKGLPQNRKEAFVQLSRILGKPRTGTHPIRYISLIEHLYATWQDFVDDVQTGTDWGACQAPTVAGSNESSDDEDESRLISLVQAGTSVTKASTACGIPLQTALEICRRHGIQITARPKVLDDDTREKIIQLLEEGEERKVVAAAFGLSVTTVSRIHRSTSGLMDRWAEAKLARQRKEHHQTWQTTAAEFPELGIKYLRSLIPGCYMWLYRNDRAWLTRECKSLPSARFGNNASVSWDERDETLSQSVLTATYELYSSGRSLPIHLWELCIAVPDLRPKLEQLDRLPLTRRAIDRAIRSQPTDLPQQTRLPIETK